MALPQCTSKLKEVQSNFITKVRQCH